MSEARGGSRQGRKKIVQHCQVELHLLTVAPPLDEARFFVDGSVDQVRNVGHLSEDFGTAPLIGEVNRQQRGARQAGRDATGDPDHVPVFKLRKMPHSGAPDQAGCARDQHFSPRHSETSFAGSLPFSFPSAPELYKTLALVAIVRRGEVRRPLKPLLSCIFSYTKTK